LGAFAKLREATVSYDNKTNKYIRRHVNLLQYRRHKPPIRFGHLLWLSSGRCFSTDMLQKHQNQFKNVKY